MLSLGRLSLRCVAWASVLEGQRQRQTSMHIERDVIMRAEASYRSKSTQVFLLGFIVDISVGIAVVVHYIAAASTVLATWFSPEDWFVFL